jgi:hypothetical protein
MRGSKRLRGHAALRDSGAESYLDDYGWNAHSHSKQWITPTPWAIIPEKGVPLIAGTDEQGSEYHEVLVGKIKERTVHWHHLHSVLGHVSILSERRPRVAECPLRIADSERELR